MSRCFLSCIASIVWLTVALTARADYLVLDLKAEADGVTKTAPSEMLAIGVAPKPREVLEVKAGNRIKIRWTARHAEKAGSLKNVVLHVAVAKEEKLGQAVMPKLGKDVTFESAQTMDFQPKDETSGEFTITIDRPGPYLLRLDTTGAAANAEGHEHFAALDLSVR